ncbi:sulfated glycoprotein 1 [Haematococcus lacustris]|uniref:Sulfated glycoprotein 1 n=1 Tax=Haematococcus lacustris TaxID=44745 RepID=A0A699ZLW3_HAELA|nr:sulfated glycoprotein 1 [Haematococcus lacustris]
MAVIEAHSLISSPSVQAEAIDYTKGMCDSFPSYADLCKQYVDTLAPMVFRMLAQYLQPDMVCTELGMCKPAPAKPFVTLTAALLGRARSAAGGSSQ